MLFYVKNRSSVSSEIVHVLMGRYFTFSPLSLTVDGLTSI